jgi:hypothetical protein
MAAATTSLLLHERVIHVECARVGRSRGRVSAGHGSLSAHTGPRSLCQLLLTMRRITASWEGSRTWTPAGPVPGRSRAPSPRRRRSAPPGPPNPRYCGRRRAGRWPRPRAVERIRLSNTPSKIIRSTASAEALAEARLSTGNSPMPVERRCGSSPENPPQTFSSTQPVDRIFPAHNHRTVVGMIISTVLSPGCAQRSRRVCTLCPHPCPLGDLVPGVADRQNVSAVSYNGVRPQQIRSSAACRH